LPIRASRLPIHVGISIVGDVGSLPQPSPALRASLSLGWHSLEARVAGSYWRTGEAELDARQGARVDLWTAGGLGCWTRHVLALCAGAELGRMKGESYGVEEARGHSGTWAAAISAVDARWAIGRGWAIAGGAELVVPVQSPLFVLADGTVLHEASAAGARLWLGTELQIH